MKYYYITNPWDGKKRKVWFEKEKYMNGNTSLELWCNEGPYTTVTVNLPNYHLEENEAFIDTNNNPDINQWLSRRGIAKPTFLRGYSGFCSYPMMRFDLSKI